MVPLRKTLRGGYLHCVDKESDFESLPCSATVKVLFGFKLRFVFFNLLILIKYFDYVSITSRPTGIKLHSVSQQIFMEPLVCDWFHCR